jgi:hypothetical protein
MTTNISIPVEVAKNYKLYTPPSPNWRLRWGDISDTCFHIYIKDPPNRFQRWMIKKVLGITWQPLHNNQ